MMTEKERESETKEKDTEDRRTKRGKKGEENVRDRRM